MVRESGGLAAKGRVPIWLSRDTPLSHSAGCWEVDVLTWTHTGMGCVMLLTPLGASPLDLGFLFPSSPPSQLLEVADWQGD